MTDKNLTPQIKRQQRIRKSLLSVTQRPRLVVTRSNQNISAQIIDKQGQVLAGFSSQSLKNAKGTNVEIASLVGTKLGDLAKEKKVTEVVFDRGSYKFHGRVKALAEAVRQSGIKF
jgi:large subunit ribosomal protein L18